MPIFSRNKFQTSDIINPSSLSRRRFLQVAGTTALAMGLRRDSSARENSDTIPRRSLGSTALVGKGAEMRNLIGSDAADWPAILKDPAAHLHLYGKHDAKPGRKMGHVTRVW